MLITFTDGVSKGPVAVNPEHVVVVFTATSGDQEGKTILGLINGNCVIDEDYLDVVGKLQGALN